MQFIQASTFDDLGGWFIDTQCIQAMGAPFLMAHGVGTPVKDAVTTIQLPKGSCHAWVRTRDWTAQWKRGTPAGQFQLLLDNTPFETILGTNGPDWKWQYAGVINVQNEGEHTLALHDLTGFNGRCDAIYLAQNLQAVPPDVPDALAELRDNFAQPIQDDDIRYDLIVVGGGYAGISTALAARFHKLKVLLIQDRPLLGGCGSSEIRVWTGGRTHIGKYPALGTIPATISPIDGHPGQRKTFEIFEDARKTQLFNQGKDLLLNEIMLKPECGEDGRINAIITQNIRTGARTRRCAALFADCTGDGTLARLAGCQFMYGREATEDYGESLAPLKRDKLVMGHSVLWEPKDEGHPVDFPDIDWGIEFNDQNGLKRFNCCWDWETGQYHDQVMDIEHIRDYGHMTVLANWSWLKNRSPYKEQVANLSLEWLSPIGGKRESYRIYGDYVMTQQDVEEHTQHEDATAATTWSIDLHLPDPLNFKTFDEGFQSCAYHRGLSAPSEIPYRCLYARDVPNLFLGGRIISATHVAFSSIRVMRTLGMLGEVAGMAAAVCIKHQCNPRDVYHSHLDDLKQLMTQGVYIDQPCGYYPGRQNAYHFMRPIGSIGNKDENVWVHCDEHDVPPPNVHPTILEAIDELGVIHP